MCNALRIPIRSQALPVHTRCPLCNRETLNLFNDNTEGGGWHHCNHCGSSGDMLELACRVWELEPADTLRRLAEEGVNVPDEALNPLAVASYTANNPNYRQQLNELWEAARDNLPNLLQSPHIADMAAQYNLHLEIGSERWRQGPGKLVGAASCTAIEKHLHKGLFKKSKGVAWQDALVVPFYDLPGRIRSFLCLGRQGRIPADQVFYRAPLRPNNQGGDDAGLGFVQSIGDCGHVIATEDWMLALQLQFRHLRTNYQPLPMVIWHDDGHVRSGASWQMLSGRRIVLWTARPDYRLILQAVATDAWINYTIGSTSPQRKMLLHYLRQKPTSHLENSIVRWAKPWPEALREWMAKYGDTFRINVIQRLEEAGADVSYILRQLGGYQAPTIRGVRAVQYGKWQIREQNDCWEQLDKQGRRLQISNAVLHLRQIIKDRDTGQLCYEGEIRHKGSNVAFIADVEDVQKKTDAFMQAKLSEAGLGVLAVENSWKKNLHHLATLFHEPQVVTDELWKRVQAMKEAQA